MPQISISIEDLVSMIDRGELRLPEMQRRYVWRAPRVRDLLDSLYATEQDAKRRAAIIRKESGVSLRAYVCHYGNGWHLTKA